MFAIKPIRFFGVDYYIGIYNLDLEKSKDFKVVVTINNKRNGFTIGEYNNIKNLLVSKKFNIQLHKQLSNRKLNYKNDTIVSKILDTIYRETYEFRNRPRHKRIYLLKSLSSTKIMCYDSLELAQNAQDKLQYPKEWTIEESVLYTN